MIRDANLRLAQWAGSRIYYGWVIAGVMFVTNLSAFAFNPIFGLFVTPLELEFGWERSMISRSLPLGAVAGSLLAPLMGHMVDRYGARRLMMLFGLGGAVGYVLLGRVQAPWQFNVLVGVVFTLQVTGTAWMMSSVNINRWFGRRRGRAMGIAMMGASGSSVIFIPLLTITIAVLGWRASYLVMAVGSVLLIVIPAFLLVVNTPDQLGLEQHPELHGGGSSGPLSGAGWSLGQALRTRPFWVVLSALMLGNFAVQGYFIHAFPHMEALGFSRVAAGSVWTAFFVVGVIAKFLWGFFIERIGVRWAMVLLFAGEALGLYLLNNARTTEVLFFYAVFNGLAHGPFLQLYAMVWADYYGRAAIGRIYGSVQPAIVISGSLGAWIGGYLFDLQGSYDLFFKLGLGLCLISALLFLATPAPRHKGGPPPVRTQPV